MSGRKAAADIWGKSLDIIHLDAHLDLCNEIDGNFLSHGYTHRRFLEKNNLPLGQVYFIGIRSFEIQELHFSMVTGQTYSRQPIFAGRESKLLPIKYAADLKNACRSIATTGSQ